MPDPTHGATAPQSAVATRPYRFIAWRWHFYAGIYVAPFLIMLAATGLVMLWISWSAGVGAERLAIPIGSTPLPLIQLQSAAEAALPGATAVQYVAPLAADRIAAFAVSTADGTMGVALNPYTAEVMRIFPWRAGWYDVAYQIHGTLMIGTLGDRLIEIAASLGMVLIASGLYLHWPRNTARFVPRLAARGRAFWVSLHGVIGVWVAGVLVVFLISGLSWSGIWGERYVQAWSTFPAGKMDNIPVSEEDIHAGMNHGPVKEVPWGLEQTPMPLSGSLMGQAAVTAPVTLDGVAAFAADLDLPGRFQINLPKGEDGVWTISHDSMSNDGHDPTADRTLHIDRFTGHVLADIHYGDYSAYAKAMAWGIAFHEGDLGLWNLALNTVFCLSVIGLSVSGLVIWWKRRPEGAARLSAPPRPRDLPFWKGAAALVLVLGLAFPLAGLAIAAMLVLDLTVLRMMPGLRRALS